MTILTLLFLSLCISFLLTPRNSELYYVYFNNYKELGFLKLRTGVIDYSEIINTKHIQTFVYNFWEFMDTMRLIQVNKSWFPSPLLNKMESGILKGPLIKCRLYYILGKIFLKLRIWICKNPDSPKVTGEKKNYPNMKWRGGKEEREGVQRDMAGRSGKGNYIY